jgi:hypothetical protein
MTNTGWRNYLALSVQGMGNISELQKLAIEMHKYIIPGSLAVERQTINY